MRPVVKSPRPGEWIEKDGKEYRVKSVSYVVVSDGAERTMTQDEIEELLVGCTRKQRKIDWR